MENETPKRGSWFSYCPCSFSGVSNIETEGRTDEAKTPVIYDKAVKDHAVIQ